MLDKKYTNEIRHVKSNTNKYIFYHFGCYKQRDRSFTPDSILGTVTN